MVFNKYTSNYSFHEGTIYMSHSVFKEINPTFWGIHFHISQKNASNYCCFRTLSHRSKSFSGKSMISHSPICHPRTRPQLALKHESETTTFAVTIKISMVSSKCLITPVNGKKLNKTLTNCRQTEKFNAKWKAKHVVSEVKALLLISPRIFNKPCTLALKFLRMNWDWHMWVSPPWPNTPRVGQTYLLVSCVVDLLYTLKKSRGFTVAFPYDNSQQLKC